MAKVVVVHGISQQNLGDQSLRLTGAPALRDGISRAEAVTPTLASALTDSDIQFAFYGDVFRPPGRLLSAGIPLLELSDVTEFEEELLFYYWAEAARTDSGVIAPDARSLARMPRSAQAALRALSGSRFFSGLAERAMIFDLVQVRRYFTEPETRDRVRTLVANMVSEDTRVLIGHSLGSVVAYEVLAANRQCPVRALITLGSPLGIRNLIFDRLQPPPVAATGPPGQWPGCVSSWTNIADEGDVVALVKDLRPKFGTAVACHTVYNGSHAHDIHAYLTTPETGAAVLAGLS
jgi:hypothetical protein